MQHSRKKRQISKKKTLNNEISKLQKEISESSDANRIELFKEQLEEKSNTFDKITETKLNGLIMRSKANIVEHDEKK